MFWFMSFIVGLYRFLPQLAVRVCPIRQQCQNGNIYANISLQKLNNITYEIWLFRISVRALHKIGPGALVTHRKNLSPCGFVTHRDYIDSYVLAIR